LSASSSALVAGQRDEVEVVDDRERTREIGDEDDGSLQRGNQNRLEAVVVGGDLRRELLDPLANLFSGEVDLADTLVG
jgi:hypothetical protein